MRKHMLAAAVVPLAALLHPSASPAAHACCEGQQPPNAAQLQFIADVHKVGLTGASATQEMSRDGPVQIGNWPGLNVGDSNILYAGVAICNSFNGPPDTHTFDYLKHIYFLLGEPIDPVDGPHPRISQVYGYAKADLCGKF
jgi:hypothetical protein